MLSCPWNWRGRTKPMRRRDVDLEPHWFGLKKITQITDLGLVSMCLGDFSLEHGVGRVLRVTLNPKLV